MDYPQQQGKLIMPEYGRNVQKMVAHALTIEDREERNRCVNTILETMSNLFPYLKQEEAYRHKIYDHLAIMSDFKLDIDWPYEQPSPEEIRLSPEKVAYPEKARLAHYGHLVELMIENAVNEKDPDTKKNKINTIANVMKRNLLVFNRDQEVDNKRIKTDIQILSNGQLSTDFPNFYLLDANELLHEKKNKKKK